MSGPEQRTSKRISRKFILRVAIDDGNPWPRWSLVTTHNISATGVSFTFDQAAKSGDILLLKIHFVDRVIDCKAKVSRISPGFQKPLVQLAATYMDLGDVDAKFIESFVKDYKETQ